MPKGNLQNLISEILKKLLCQIFPYFLLTYPNTWAIYIFNISISEQKKGKNMFSVNNPTKQKYVFPHTCVKVRKKGEIIHPKNFSNILSYSSVKIDLQNLPKFCRCDNLPRSETTIIISFPIILNIWACVTFIMGKILNIYHVLSVLKKEGFKKIFFL